MCIKQIRHYSSVCYTIFQNMSQSVFCYQPHWHFLSPGPLWISVSQMLRLDEQTPSQFVRSMPWSAWDGHTPPLTRVPASFQASNPSPALPVSCGRSVMVCYNMYSNHGKRSMGYVWEADLLNNFLASLFETNGLTAFSLQITYIAF